MGISSFLRFFVLPFSLFLRYF